jgi:hypothetical protein
MALTHLLVLCLLVLAVEVAVLKLPIRQVQAAVQVVVDFILLLVVMELLEKEVMEELAEAALLILQVAAVEERLRQELILAQQPLVALVAMVLLRFHLGVQQHQLVKT